MNRLIAYFLDAKVSANLLMVFIVAGGFIAVSEITHEVFPKISPGLVTVTVAWPGASPEEIEDGICVKIEEAIEGAEGVKRVSSAATENAGLVKAELYPDADRASVVNDLRTRVGAISTLPDDAEKPIVSDVEMPNLVMDLVVSADLSERALKALALEIRDELASLPEVSRVEVVDDREYEIRIEVSETALRRYRLDFDDAVAAVRQGSLRLAGGSLKAKGGEILIRTDAQGRHGADFEEILLFAEADGTRIRLGDVARITDGFVDEEKRTTFDGRPALTLQVFRSGSQSVREVAAAVYSWIEAKRKNLPEGARITIGADWAERLDERLGLMVSSGVSGLILILVTLTLFLRFRLAFWVSAGIPVAMLGAIWLMPLLGTTINMMSLFGFVLVLGILVDDGIVVAENIHHHASRGLAGREAARVGTIEVAKPVILAALTTIAAFLPMLSLPGTMGQFARDIPVVVILAIAVSLVESLLILPRHMSHGGPAGRKREPALSRLLSAPSRAMGAALTRFAENIYRPVLDGAVRWRYLTLTLFVAGLGLTAVLFFAGYVKFDFFPPIAGDQVVASVSMPPGTASARTSEAVEQILAGVQEVRRRYDEAGNQDLVEHVRVTVGSRPEDANRAWETGGTGPEGSHVAEVFLELAPPDRRENVPAEEVMNELRKTVGEIPGARELRYDVAISGIGRPIDVELRSASLEVLRVAADRLKATLREKPGVHDVSDDLVPGPREIRLDVKPGAEALGVTRAELIRQVRQGFYGEEAQRIQRGREEVTVRVLYPEESRRTLADLDAMRFRLPDGAEVPFGQVATTAWDRGPVVIHRVEGLRRARVTADVDPTVANANEILAELGRTVLPDLVREHPGLGWSFEGAQREQAETLGGLFKGSIYAVLIIFTLLAVAFGSFLQPFIVLSAVPFALVGAVLGHMLFGRDLTMLSSVGILAMAGVAVNDSLVLVDYVNAARAEGRSVREALLEAGPRRFRPVLLTSATTFAGLFPLIMDQSVGAQFLIPMAISLAFGVLAATLVTLFLVPVLYRILCDLAPAAVGDVPRDDDFDRPPPRRATIRVTSPPPVRPPSPIPDLARRPRA